MKEVILNAVALYNSYKTEYTYDSRSEFKASILEFLKKSLDDLCIPYKLVKDKDGIFILPKGVQEFDDNLVSKPLGQVPSLIEFVLGRNDLITKENKDDLFFIVFENLNKYDFSEFIKRFANQICKDFEDFGLIWEYYKDSPFARDDVVQCLQERVGKSLSDNIESILLEKTDASECTSSCDVDDALESFLERIQEDFPFLTEEEIDDIRCSVDSQKIVEENDANLYYECDVDDIQKMCVQIFY